MPPNDQPAKLLAYPTLAGADTFSIVQPNVYGEIVLVGAGPGDPDLLTLAALKAIQRADLVVSDRLIPEAILDLIKCELLVARKLKGRADEAQDELNEWCLHALREGKYVVRLKIGDPLLFGRGGEEILFFRQYGYECKVIPGVSSSLSAPLVAGIPSTHRGVADQVLIVTGHGRGGSVPELPTYSAHRTTIFLMAIGRLATVTSGLIEQQQFPADCPVAVIENATLPKQRVIRGTLTTIAKQCADANVKPPACFVVGHVVNVLDNSRVASLVPESSLAQQSLYQQEQPLRKPIKEAVFTKQHARIIDQPATDSLEVYSSSPVGREYKCYKDILATKKLKVVPPSEQHLTWGACLSDILEQRNNTNAISNACVL